MDSNRDGLIDKEEYMLASRDTLNVAGQQKTDFRKSVYRVAERLFDMCDIDGGGMLDRDELDFCEHVVGTELSLAKSGHAKEIDYAGEGEEEFGGRRAASLLASFDTDRDGLLDSKEFANAAQDAFKAWGWSESAVEHPLVLDKFRGVFDKAEGSGDRRLGRREFQYAAWLLHRIATKEMAVSLMSSMDTDGDRMIGREELARQLEQRRTPGASQGTIADFVLESFDALDRNGDGFLNVQETERAAAQVLNGYARRDPR